MGSGEGGAGAQVRRVRSQLIWRSCSVGAWRGEWKTGWESSSMVRLWTWQSRQGQRCTITEQRLSSVHISMASSEIRTTFSNSPRTVVTASTRPPKQPPQTNSVTLALRLYWRPSRGKPLATGLLTSTEWQTHGPGQYRGYFSSVLRGRNRWGGSTCISPASTQTQQSEAKGSCCRASLSRKSFEKRTGLQSGSAYGGSSPQWWSCQRLGSFFVASMTARILGAYHLLRKQSRFLSMKSVLVRLRLASTNWRSSPSPKMMKLDSICSICLKKFRQKSNVRLKPDCSSPRFTFHSPVTIVTTGPCPE